MGKQWNKKTKWGNEFVFNWRNFLCTPLQVRNGSLAAAAGSWKHASRARPGADGSNWVCLSRQRVGKQEGVRKAYSSTEVETQLAD